DYLCPMVLARQCCERCTGSSVEAIETVKDRKKGGEICRAFVFFYFFFLFSEIGSGAYGHHPLMGGRAAGRRLRPPSMGPQNPELGPHWIERFNWHGLNP